MKRREFISLLGGAAMTAISRPFAAAAQPVTKPSIGFLSPATPVIWAPLISAFKTGLAEMGYAEGGNVTIEYRWAEGQYHRLPTLAAELVQSGVSVIAALGPPTPQAAKGATTTIPIVFLTNSDPVASGLVTSMNRPGGNLTGMDTFTSLLAVKRLELMRDWAPRASTVGFLYNPDNAASDRELVEMQRAARQLGWQLIVAKTADENGFVTAIDSLAAQGSGALVIAADPYYLSRRDRLVEAISRHPVPVIFALREYAAAGGLISYGVNLADLVRQAGVCVGRILKGEKPADLPVVQPTKFELVINLKTAKALGLEVPPMLLARADEVIE